MNPCVVYHWWQSHCDKPPVRNHRAPIAASIATLRACNPNVPVIVLEMGPAGPPADWGALPSKLGFTVIPRTFSLAPHADKKGWMIVSRFEDVIRFAEESSYDTFVYADSDTFWINGPFPLTCSPSKFTFNGYNNGFFYFDKTSPDVREFFAIYLAYLKTAYHDEAFRIITRQYNKPVTDFFVFDEALTRYISMKLPDLVNITPTHDHLTGDTLMGGPELIRLNLSTVRMVHAHGLRVNDPFQTHPSERLHARGLACLIIQPLIEAIQKTVGIDLLYGRTHHKLTEFAVPLDSALIKRLIECKESDGFYNLMNACNVPVILPEMI